MEEFKIHFYIAFFILIAFAIAIGFALLQNLPKFISSKKKRATTTATVLTTQGIAITLFCAFYLILEFTAQSS